MNEGDAKYRAMISYFRISELHLLLSTYGQNKSGNKSELRARALNLLNSKLSGRCYSLYRLSIANIYQTFLINMSSNSNLLPNLHYQRHWAPGQLTLLNQFPYPQPKLRTIRPRLFSFQQVHSHENIRYNMPINCGNLVTVPLVPSPQQLQETKEMRSTTSQNITRILLSPKLTYKKLPFYEFIKAVIPPTILVGTDKITLPSTIKDIGMREAVFHFRLPIEDINNITMRCDNTEILGENSYQMIIRIYQFKHGSKEIIDGFPPLLQIKINGTSCLLPPLVPPIQNPSIPTPPGPKPINCSYNFRHNPSCNNSVTVNWFQNEKTFVFELDYVKSLNSEMLVKRLIDKGVRSSEEMKTIIMEKATNVDQDLATTSCYYSLLCPLSKRRMELPARSIKCVHLQCFDLRFFISMNEKNQKWLCPTCIKPCLVEDIRIEAYFWDIIASPKLPENCENIEILPDGSWKAYEKLKETSNVKETRKNNKSLDLVIVIDDDSDYNDNKNFQSTVIDLTVSDDDDDPQKNNDKSENGA